MTNDVLGELIEASDLAGLVRHIDGTCKAREWDDLVSIVERCEEAVTRGKQVWGAGQYAEYRLALDAPAAYAAAVLRSGAGRFALGPLWEVAASSHPWAELEALVDDPQLRVLAAHERVLRGEAIDPSLGDRMLVDAPLELASWEPDYPTAVYRSDGVADPEIDLPPMSWSELPDLGHERRTDNGSQALVDLVQPWIEDSNGRGEAIVVEGSALDAIRTLGPRRVLLAELTFGQALAVMTWTGASGGAHGRRRGTPVGRALSWWALASLVGLDDDWPVDADELGEAASELRWWRWDPGEDIGGWAFNLAVEDPVDGLAWAVSAADAL